MAEISEATARFLLSGPGRALLGQAEALRGEGAGDLAALTRLRKTAAPEEAAAAWEMSGLRRRAVVKFGPDAGQMFLTREALEQASGLRAAAYHARRYREAGLTSVSDLGGGIGGDSLAFARAGLTVTLVERDPVRALFAAENARAWGVPITIRLGDVTEDPPRSGAVWIDPARRTDGVRTINPDDYRPPLSFLETVEAGGIRDWGAKIAPATDHAVAEMFSAELEFLSDGGECKEALLWSGALRSDETRRATVLTEAGPLSLTGDWNAAPPAAPDGFGHFLWEPDPAAIRARLLGPLAARLDARAFDPQIAYLLGERAVSTPFAQAYEILDRFPYHRRRLQEALNAVDAGRVVIKKRGFPHEPEDVRKGLRLRGSREATVVLTRRGETHWAFLVRPVTAIL